MNATVLRRNVQEGKILEASDFTRRNLADALRNTRLQFGGLSVLEICEVIRESIKREEVLLIKNSL